MNSRWNLALAAVIAVVISAGVTCGLMSAVRADTADDLRRRALPSATLTLKDGTVVDSSNPLPTSATITPSGTQNVNLTQILSAAPSLTNPLWVTPATGATFTVTGTLAATQSGTWTVQPGNTANTTAWLVTGTGGTFPATQSGTWTVQPGNTANTTAWLVTGTGGTFPVSFPAAGTGPVGTKAAGTAAATALLDGGVYNATPPAATDGQQVASQADQTGARRVNTEGQKATYSAFSLTTLAAAATDVVTITGSASKTIRITRIQLSGTATAASGTEIRLAKYSTAGSGGAATTRVNIPHDSASAAGSATVKAYTTNQTVGTLVGYLRDQIMTFTTTAGAIPMVPVVWDFTMRNSQGIVLRGTGEYAAVHLSGATVTGGILSWDMEWTEE